MQNETDHKNAKIARLAAMREADSTTLKGDCTQAIRSLLLSHGLIVHPESTELLESSAYRTERGVMRFVRTRSTYRFDHPQSDTFERVQVLAEAADIGDRAIEKAQAVALRQALGQLLMLDMEQPVVSASAKDLSAGGTWPTVAADWWKDHAIQSPSSARKGRTLKDLIATEPGWFMRAATEPKARKHLTDIDKAAIDEAHAWLQTSKESQSENVVASSDAVKQS